MSILIKGMEMPQNCAECRFFAWKRGVGQHCAVAPDITFHATIDGMDAGYERNGDCPLVPVPPHGRLIDADALRCLYDPHDYGLDGEQADEYDRYHVSLPVIRQNIDDMPTIIPASEEGET